MLDGSGSSDKDGDIESYRWVQTSGNPVHIMDGDLQKASFIAPDNGPEPEILMFELTVTDRRGESDIDRCIVELW